MQRLTSWNYKNRRKCPLSSSHFRCSTSFNHHVTEHISSTRCQPSSNEKRFDLTATDNLLLALDVFLVAHDEDDEDLQPGLFVGLDSFRAMLETYKVVIFNLGF